MLNETTTDLLKSLLNMGSLEISRKFAVTVETIEIWTGSKMEFTFIVDGLGKNDAKRKVLNKFDGMQDDVSVVSIEPAASDDTPSITIKEIKA